MLLEFVAIRSIEALIHFTLEKLVLWTIQTHDNFLSELRHVEPSFALLLSARGAILVRNLALMVLTGLVWVRGSQLLD